MGVDIKVHIEMGSNLLINALMNSAHTQPMVEILPSDAVHDHSMTVDICQFLDSVFLPGHWTKDDTLTLGLH